MKNLLKFLVRLITVGIFGFCGYFLFNEGLHFHFGETDGLSDEIIQNLEGSQQTLLVFGVISFLIAIGSLCSRTITGLAGVIILTISAATLLMRLLGHILFMGDVNPLGTILSFAMVVVSLAVIITHPLGKPSETSA